MRVRKSTPLASEVIKVAKACLGAAERKAVGDVFVGGWLGMGEFTLRFETTLQDYLGAQNVISVNTGTAALHLALAALGVGPGDEVIAPSLTFIATFQAISATGATPVACEVDPDTLLMDLDDAERRITPRTRAVVPVHYGGQPCDMVRLLSWRVRYGVRIVEDAAHAFGSDIAGRKVGACSDVACFSFDPIKVITCGEGGAIVTDDDDLAVDLRNRRLLGVDRESDFRYRNERQWHYNVAIQGFRCHLSNVNAAIGLAQLQRLDQFVSRRREICCRYDEAFADVPVVTRLNVRYESVAPFMYVVRVPADLRERFMEALREREIETGVHYLPNHWHRLYAATAGPKGLPVTDKVGQQIVTLPLHSGLTDQEVEHVIAAVRSFDRAHQTVS